MNLKTLILPSPDFLRIRAMKEAPKNLGKLSYRVNSFKSANISPFISLQRLQKMSQEIHLVLALYLPLFHLPNNFFFQNHSSVLIIGLKSILFLLVKNLSFFQDTLIFLKSQKLIFSPFFYIPFQSFKLYSQFNSFPPINPKLLPSLLKQSRKLFSSSHIISKNGKQSFQIKEDWIVIKSGLWKGCLTLF